MKKIAAAVLAFILLMISAGSSFTYAAGTVSRGNATGQLKDVKYSSDGSSEVVTITAKNYVDYSVMELSDPRRIVLDIFNILYIFYVSMLSNSANAMLYSCFV